MNNNDYIEISIDKAFQLIEDNKYSIYVSTPWSNAITEISNIEDFKKLGIYTLYELATMVKFYTLKERI